MLRHLHISGLGVIDDVDLRLHPGLNVLTGETGAGKTLITAGVSLATGARASARRVRGGHRAARVQASFDAPPGAEEWEEDGAVLLSRGIGADGKSTARIGAQLVTASTLAEVGGRLVEVHGQHHAQRLLSPAFQRGLLDRFAGDRHVVAVVGLREAFEAWSRVTHELQELQRAARDRERELDLLAYQVREIESVGPHADESQLLETEERRLAHVERLTELAALALEQLGGDRGAADQMAAVAEGLAQISSLDPTAAELAARSTSIAAESAELVRDLQAHAETLQPDPARLDEVRARMSELGALRRKYGATDAEVLGFAAAARRRIDELGGADRRLQGLETTARDARADLHARAQVVSSGRRRRAPAMVRAITAELAELGMEGAQAGIEIRELEEPGPSGAESVDLTLVPGHGQAAAPITVAASGGELSRTVLAIRSVLADADDVPTLVFDEIDAGIGGRAGLAVGRRLARLARSRQVLVVSHLPQIACFADHHVMVTKEGGIASARELDGSERVRELSRMLAGLDASRSAEGHARELLEEASRERQLAR